ncbi:hypothetical protein NAPIS_ORF02545 [Vairimorpha apis BRL 01]|uniref:Uncharacterized protein n=1 Tax=Vairimorpha apis BRL 01 TaxID=1037528 RepID=T0L585_9MICR|nr:hypothetical protein NAPIS_ORF02545 [Vairimorpha apis BRL 01]
MMGVEDMDIQDVILKVDGKIDIHDDKVQLSGTLSNTDKFSINGIEFKMMNQCDVIRNLFLNEVYVEVGGFWVFKRVGVEVYVRDGVFKIRRRC